MGNYYNLLSQAGNVAAQPYVPYSGELVAPVNAQQQTGIGNINQYSEAAQPALQTSEGMAYNAAQPITQSQIQGYMSPYTQDVVNATEQQFQNQNAIQQSGVTGNAIAQGALGGNRSAVAQGIVAGQQQAAEAPVIAGLENQGYTTGLNTALTEQQAMGQGALSLGNLATAAQNAGLTGANAQVGAGTLEQQTQQAADTAQQNAFYQQEFAPEAMLSWESGIDTGVGSQMGGTSTTTAPAPSVLSQMLGLGTGALGILGGTGAFGSQGYLNYNNPNSIFGSGSDRRIKENIKRIGKLNDGQPIYRFNYKGDPATHIGLIAQNVEKKHPDAVREFNGIKHVNYDEATRDAVRRNSGGLVPHFDGGGNVNAASLEPELQQALLGLEQQQQDVIGSARGGVVPHFDAGGITPYFSNRYIPTQPITRGSGPPRPPNSPQQPNAQQMTNQIGSLTKALTGGGQSQGVNPTNVPGATNQYGVTAQNGQPTTSPSFGPVGMVPDVVPLGGGAGNVTGIYRRGGVVPGYADGGGDDSFNDRFAGWQDLPSPTEGLGLAPNLRSDWQSGDAYPLRDVNPKTDFTPDRGGIFDPTTGTSTSYENPYRVDETPLPRSRPQVEDTDTINTPEGDVSVAQVGRGLNGPLPDDLMSFADTGQAPSAGVAPSGIDLSGSSKLWPALMSAGFGMMASRSPFPGVAIGEGGERGVGTYTQLAEKEAEHKLSQEQINNAAKKLSDEAEYHNKMLAQKTAPHVIAEEERETLTGTQKKKIYGDWDPVLKRYVPVEYTPANASKKSPLAPLTPQEAPQPNAPQQPQQVTPPPPQHYDESLAPGGIHDAETARMGSAEPGISPQEKQWRQGVEQNWTRSVAPPGAQTGQIELHPEVLQKYSPSEQSLIKGIAEYKQKPPPLGRDAAIRLAAAVREYSPTYDEARYPTRAAAMKAFVGNGPEARNLQSIDMAIQHVAGAMHNIDQLDNYSMLPDYINPIRNYVRGQTDKEFQAVKGRFGTDVSAVGTELAKTFRGVGAMSEREAADWQHKFGMNMSPVEMRAALQEAGEKLVNARLEASTNRYNDAVGPGYERSPVSWLSREGQASLKYIMSVDPQTGKPLTVDVSKRPEDVQRGATTVPQTLPPEAQRNLKEGEPTHFRNGQTWTLRNGQPVRVQ
jgi:hypothetical protein